MGTAAFTNLSSVWGLTRTKRNPVKYYGHWSIANWNGIHQLMVMLINSVKLPAICPNVPKWLDWNLLHLNSSVCYFCRNFIVSAPWGVSDLWVKAASGFKGKVSKGYSHRDTHTHTHTGAPTSFSYFVGIIHYHKFVPEPSTPNISITSQKCL